eukprot:3409469-Amphidinium_carterae.1
MPLVHLQTCSQSLSVEPDQPEESNPSADAALLESKSMLKYIQDAADSFEPKVVWAVALVFLANSLAIVREART